MCNPQKAIDMKIQLNKILFFLAAFLCCSMELLAEDLLVLEFNNGDKITWKTSELPVVTTHEDNVLVTTKDQSLGYTITTVQKFYIDEDNSTNISSQIESKRAIKITNGRISIRGLLPYGQCKVFNLDGTLERQQKADTNGTICFEGLSSGIHIISFKQEAVKVILP